MKPLVIFLTLFILTACNQAKKSQNQETPRADEKEEAEAFPPAIQMVLEAHGGLERWKEQKTLQFQMVEDQGSVTHTIDLGSGMDRIDGPTYSLGFDGQDVWLADSAKTFEGDPVFYHNLMFYFYAMPFVFADTGIVYGETEELVYDGNTYPGIRINYQGGVGTSPKDEYYVYYHPETHVMTWLGYTVTYFSDAPSDDLHWVRYDDWNEVDGLLLPSEMTWYNYEGRTIKDARQTVAFEGVSLSDSSRGDEFYQGPEDARVVQKDD
jgi:hypothetical protein